jgi:hypothetical protein
MIFCVDPKSFERQLADLVVSTLSKMEGLRIFRNASPMGIHRDEDGLINVRIRFGEQVSKNVYRSDYITTTTSHNYLDSYDAIRHSLVQNKKNRKDSEHRFRTGWR